MEAAVIHSQLLQPILYPMNYLVQHLTTLLFKSLTRYTALLQIVILTLRLSDHQLMFHTQAMLV